MSDIVVELAKRGVITQTGLVTTSLDGQPCANQNAGVIKDIVDSGVSLSGGGISGSSTDSRFISLPLEFTEFEWSVPDDIPEGEDEDDWGGIFSTQISLQPQNVKFQYKFTKCEVTQTGSNEPIVLSYYSYVNGESTGNAKDEYDGWSTSVSSMFGSGATLVSLSEFDSNYATVNFMVIDVNGSKKALCTFWGDTQKYGFARNRDWVTALSSIRFTAEEESTPDPWNEDKFERPISSLLTPFEFPMVFEPTTIGVYTGDDGVAWKGFSNEIHLGKYFPNYFPVGQTVYLIRKYGDYYRCTQTLTDCQVWGYFYGDDGSGNDPAYHLGETQYNIGINPQVASNDTYFRVYGNRYSTHIVASYRGLAGIDGDVWPDQLIWDTVYNTTKYPEPPAASVAQE